MNKTFLLGFGAQKAGTTWTQRYLAAHPQCAVSHFKEMAVLSNYYSNRKNVSKRLLNKLKVLEQHVVEAKDRAQKGKDVPGKNEWFMFALDYNAADYDLEYYLSFYRRLQKQQPNAKVLTDITPAYCTLEESDMVAARDLLEQEGYNVKAFFLMRDPVERIYSALRMFARDKEKDRPNSDPHEGFYETAITDWSQANTRYELIVPRIENAFGKENCMFDFYESFISDTRIRAFCEFLDIDFVDPDLGLKANVSPRETEPDPEAWQNVRDAYKETYDFCAEKFGKAKVSEIWKM